MYKHSNTIGVLLVIASLAMVSLVCTSGGARDSSSDGDPLTAILAELQGVVQTLKPAEGVFKEAHNGQILAERDQLLTHEDGRARLDISNGTIVRVGPLSTFVLERIERRTEGPFLQLKLEVGELWIILNGGSIDVDTPSGIASVRGSFMSVRVVPGEEKTTITCLEGDCQVGNQTGTLKLVAGQSAELPGQSSPPTPGQMSDEQVMQWLQVNPEATMVIVPLTATVGALPENPPSLLTNTPMSQATATAVDCGPPEGWTLYTVQEEDSLPALAEAFAVPLEELQHANCLGDSTAILAGQSIFVPDAPTITPTPTLTAAATNSPEPTQQPPTSTATKDPSTIFANAVGPASGEPISTCANEYSVDVEDIDGVDFVRVEYRVNDPTFEGSASSPLTNIEGVTWSALLTIDTAANSSDDLVYWRFWAKDGLGNSAYYPAVGGFEYSDSLNCLASP